ncbi:MAG TPA: response regulator [bacterium]|nr:response regulator [bacterium]HPN45724.1 response regulator [bacterium]
MEKLIVLIDDDKLPMKYYIIALKQKDFKVIQFLEPDSAFEFIQNEKVKIFTIILDIMISPGEKYKHVNTREGLDTGLFLFEDIRKICPNTPIFVLTNVNHEKTINKLRNLPLVTIIQKTKCPPSDFANLIETCFANSKE